MPAKQPSALKRERDRLYYQKHRDKIKKRIAEYRHQHPEVNRRHYQKHREEILKQHKHYREAHKAETAAYYLEWSKANLNRSRLIKQCGGGHRRARKYSAKGSIPVAHVRELLQRQEEKCAICQKPFPPEEALQRFHIDHIMPFVKGGSNCPTNIQLLCPPCNRKKGST
jgi:5-methylcytosine-specific restriction endonuclease McrA